MPNLDLTILCEDGEGGEGGLIVSSIPAVPGVLSQGRGREEARSRRAGADALL